MKTRTIAIAAVMATGASLGIAAPASAATSTTWDCRKNREVRMTGTWHIKDHWLTPVAVLWAQRDGNLVLRNHKTGTVLWNSKTGNPNYRENRDGGSVLLHADGKVTVHSGLGPTGKLIVNKPNANSCFGLWNAQRSYKLKLDRPRSGYVRFIHETDPRVGATQSVVIWQGPTG